MKSISFTVTNDLSQDQRMNRICSSLVTAGYHSTLIGRQRLKSKVLSEKPFLQKRISCFFEKGKLFYLEYNFRLFFVLLFSKYDAYCAIDLDTILPNYLASKIKGKPLVYDAHEYFTELEEVVSRPFTQWVWKSLEKWLVPKIKCSYTVSEGYKMLFDKEYNTDFGIIRNATVLQDFKVGEREEKYILYQGAVNHGRGLEQLIVAMVEVDCKLIICGDGDILPALKELVEEKDLHSKVDFKGFVEPVDLAQYTRNATIGITLFANAGLSNKYSLANRFFDYMHASVPQLAMNYPEYENFNSKWEIACLLQELDADSIKNALNKLLTDKIYYDKLSVACERARQVNCWQEEEKELVKIYQKVFS
ncbi:MAG: glycosyltransferase [Flavobacteriales bacterium]|nr:glycosyltransferase [Flavobacteriales bacterium]